LHDQQPVVLSTWHVLFGNGAREGEAVWLVNEANGERTYSTLGRALYGKLGRVRFGDEEHFIDCAVSSCLLAPEDAFLSNLDRPTANPDGHNIPRVGDRVTKTGAATGTTTGIIIAVNYSKTTVGQTDFGPNQILIKPVDDEAFAAEGDSGSIILSESQKAVGLLWGSNTRGEGVACAIAPVIHAMNITLARL
jgi:hypothetical protein